MYKCDICGRKLKKKISLYGYCLCSKHMHQLLKYGKFLDNIQRTNQDLNEYRYLDRETIEFDVYYQDNTYCDSFIIDAEDLNKVKYFKWRKGSGHIITGNCTKNNPSRQITHIILNVPDGFIVDHIDGNPLNNKKNNLRVTTQQNNLCNKHFMTNNTSGFIGVSWSKSRNYWESELRKDKIRLRARYKKFEEAVYARYLSEVYVFKEYRNTNNDEAFFEQINKISEERKEEIKKHILDIINKKFQN